MSGKSRFVALAALFLAVAMTGKSDLLVSTFGDGQIHSFNATSGAVIVGPPILQGGGGGEGVACLTVGGRAVYYVANNGSTIRIYDQNGGAFLGTLADLGPGSAIAGVSLSPDASLLYVADWHGNVSGNFSTSRLVALDTTTGAVVYSVNTPNAHDVAVGPDGSVYATYFNAHSGVIRFSPQLVQLGQFIAPGDNGLTSPGGMAFDATGNFFFVSNFSSLSFVNEYSVSSSGVATFVRTFNLPSNSAPLGLARGPNGNIYTANFNSKSVSEINLGNNLVTTFIPDTVGNSPKYVFFTEDCKVAANAFLEVCKASSLTDPVTGNFTFTATNGSFSTPPIIVPPGVCSGPIPVVAGTVTVTETAVQGTGVSSITAYGFHATTSIVENRLVSSNLANRTAAVTVPSGGIASQTIVEFTNFKTPTGVLEVCKDAAPGTTLSGNFTFNAAGAANNPYSIPAGACSGPILVQAGAVTITETPRAGFVLTAVGTVPADRLVSINIPSGSAVANVPAGDVSSETVARFINGPSAPSTGQLKLCKVAGPGVLLGQSFTIAAGGANYTVPAGPASQGGYCVLDGTYPIGTPVVVQETPPPPYRVLNIGVNPPSRINGAPVLANGNGQVTVLVGGGFTEVTFTNVGGTPGGQLKICKIAGPGVPIGTNFSFTAANATTGATQTYTVPAGPAAQGGYCVADSTIPAGTHLNVSEFPQQGYALAGVSVNGTALPPGTPSAAVTIGSGVTEVAFTNRRSDVPTNTTPLLNIVNYELVARHADGSLTYRADLLNSGTAIDAVIASATSADANVQVMSGDGVLRFQPVPANTQVTSSNTFTVRTDGADVDFSRLQWKIETKTAPTRRRAMH